MPAASASSYFFDGGNVPGAYTPSLQQQRADAIQAAARAEARRPLFRPPPPAPAPLAATESLTDRRVAEELEFLRRMVDLMGEKLSTDPILLSRHADVLQNFDRVEQMLGHLASVVAASDKDEAVSRIGMQDLRARLKRQPIAT
jgi:hypothetical protein